jgi:enolase
MSVKVSSVTAVEILDSRSRPTLATTITLDDGAVARAGVPSGASTGSREAVELRDGDPGRFAGLSVLGAVAAVNGEIAGWAQMVSHRRLVGKTWGTEVEWDK